MGVTGRSHHRRDLGPAQQEDGVLQQPQEVEFFSLTPVSTSLYPWSPLPGLSL
jgi:hypothetical protein